jgi:hypothetical protein
VGTGVVEQASDGLGDRDAISLAMALSQESESASDLDKQGLVALWQWLQWVQGTDGVFEPQQGIISHCEERSTKGGVDSEGVVGALNGGQSCTKGLHFFAFV